MQIFRTKMDLLVSVVFRNVIQRANVLVTVRRKHLSEQVRLLLNVLPTVKQGLSCMLNSSGC